MIGFAIMATKHFAEVNLANLLGKLRELDTRARSQSRRNKGREKVHSEHTTMHMQFPVMEGSRSHPVDEECMASATSGDTSLGAQPRLVESGGDEECMAFATSSEVNGSRQHSASCPLAQGLANKGGHA